MKTKKLCVALMIAFSGVVFAGNDADKGSTPSDFQEFVQLFSGIFNWTSGL